MFALAVLICLFFLVREGRQKGIKSEVFYDLCFWILLSAIIGARLLYVFTNLEVYLANPLQILNIRQGGQAWFGGLVFGMLAAIIFTKIKGISFLYIADIFAPFLALGQAIGRIGCFLNGCCYGKPTGSIFGLTFPGHLGPIHPTQLYSFFGLLLIFAILTVYKRGKNIVAGEVFSVYLFFYGVNRFLIEFFRGDTISSPVFNLTLYQIFSFLLIVSTISLFLILKRKKS